MEAIREEEYTGPWCAGVLICLACEHRQVAVWPGEPLSAGWECAQCGAMACRSATALVVDCRE